MYILPGNGNHLVDALDQEWEDEQRAKKKKQREEHLELTNCEDI